MSGEKIVAMLKANPVGVACGAVSLALAVGIFLRSDRVPAREAALDQKASQGERIDANLKNGVQLREQLAAISVSRAQIESRMVHPDELAQNLQFFYKLEAETGTKLVDLGQNSLGTNKSFARGKNYIYVGYRLSVRGDYARLMDFLRRLESNQRFCRVLTATLGVTGATDKDRAGEMTINLGLELLGLP